MPSTISRRPKFIRYVLRLSRLEDMKWIDWFLLFILLTIAHLPVILKFYRIDLVNNGYLQLADAMLHGRFHLPDAGVYPDLINYQGKWYVPYPPFPAIVMMPFVAVLGKYAVNTVVMCIVLTCINLVLSKKLLEKLEVPSNLHSWLIAGFLFGTGYWFSLFSSMYVYFIAHIVSVTLQLLFLNELFGRKRSLLMGLIIACSLLTRQFTVMYVLFGIGYLIYKSREESRPFPLFELTRLCLGTGTGVVVYLLYNYLRFGNLFDVGYGYIAYNAVLADRVRDFGVFSTRYFWFNFYSFFLKGFNIEFEGPGLMNIKGMDVWGTSFISASPFLITAFRATGHVLVKGAAWLTILIILTGQLFYHNNGFLQINSMRFTLDFLPLLFVLIALGAQAIPRWLFRSLVVYSVLLNVVAMAVYYTYR